MEGALYRSRWVLSELDDEDLRRIWLECGDAAEAIEKAQDAIMGNSRASSLWDALEKNREQLKSLSRKAYQLMAVRRVKKEELEELAEPESQEIEVKKEPVDDE